MKKVILLALALVCLLPGTASASLGNTAVGTSDQPGAGSAGNAQDWKSTAATTETVNRLNVYLFNGSAKPDLAIYNAAKAKIASCTITTAVTANNWYSCAVTQSPAPTISSGAVYYRAILSPKSAGIVNFANHAGTGTASFGMKQTSCPAPCNVLPSTWVDGTSYGSSGQNASMYADSSTPPVDTTAPTVAVTSPVAGSTTNTSVNATATASDASGVWFVAFRLDSTTADPVCIDYDAPYTCSLTGLADGSHTVYARAVDNAAAHNTSGDASVTWTVDHTYAPGAPAPIDGQGYTKAWGDEFDGSALDTLVWTDHIWYDGLPSASWTGFQSVSGGFLTLRSSRNFTCNCSGRTNYPQNTVTTQTHKTFTRGYFEARMKVPAGQGSWPGFWLYSERHADNPSYPAINPYCATNGLPAAECYSGELDIYEGQGNQPRIFYGTEHRNSCNCYGVSNTQSSPNSVDTGVDLSQAFHTYGALWTGSLITWYLDDQPVGITAVPYDSLNQPMFVLLQEWIGGWNGDPDATTPANLDNVIDWVRVWQKTA